MSTEWQPNLGVDKGCEDPTAHCGGALRPGAGPHLGEIPFLEGFSQVGMVIRVGFLPNGHGLVRDSRRWPPAAAEGAVLVQNRMENHSAALGSKFFFDRMIKLLIL